MPEAVKGGAKPLSGTSEFLASCLEEARSMGQCEYAGCLANKCISSTIARLKRSPRLCPGHMRTLSELLMHVPRRRAPAFVAKWTRTNCKKSADRAGAAGIRLPNGGS